MVDFYAVHESIKYITNTLGIITYAEVTDCHGAIRIRYTRT